MEILKLYSKKSFWVIIIFALLVCICINVGFYFGIHWLILNLFKDTWSAVIADNLELLSANFYLWVVPATTGFLLLCGVILWFILRNSILKIFNKIPISENEIVFKGKAKKDFVDQKIAQDRKVRLFLHSLSVLQRDGRLLDFFDEDLSLYEDEQIGAAVRSVQEDCKKTIKKYIDLKPVMENDEGEMVTIEPGFDIDAIKLVGNVSGEPPFEGVLKHRGWKAGKKEIPKLSDIQDAAVIIPAEVEIQ